MELKLLSEKQLGQLEELKRYYKHFFICNKCGSIYGADHIIQKFILCPICETKRNLDKASKKKNDDLKGIKKMIQ